MVLEAAYQVFLSDGYTAATVDDIAQRASVAKPTVYNYFQTKERLFSEAVSLSRENLRAELLTVAGSLPEELCPQHFLAAFRQWAARLAEVYASNENTDLRRLLLVDGFRLPDWPAAARYVVAHPFPIVLRGLLKAQADRGYLKFVDDEDLRRASHQFAALTLDESAQLALIGEELIESPAEVAIAGMETFLARYGTATWRSPNSDHIAAHAFDPTVGCLGYRREHAPR